MYTKSPNALRGSWALQEVRCQEQLPPSDNHKPLLTLPNIARVWRKEHWQLVENRGTSPINCFTVKISVHPTSMLLLCLLYLFTDIEKAWKEKTHL